MAKFFVGQRVRLVVSAKYVGITGRIAAFGQWRLGDLLPYGYRLSSPYADCVVEWERPVTDSKGTTDWVAPCTVDRLEPILPDGHREGDYTNVQDLLDSLTREHA